MSARSSSTTSVVLIGLMPLLIGGCRSLETLKQRCASGEIQACESACAKGVAGEQGCFYAADEHRRRAALDVKSAEFALASKYFTKSCDGGYGDGCLFAAQMLETPYNQPDGDALPPLISDAEVLEREKRLSLACDRGSNAGCKRLGDVLIGKNADRARLAYAKACRASTETTSCLAARTSEVNLADRWKMACTHGAANECAKLGDLLYAVDPPRAFRLFVSECQLRGVADVVGGVGKFVSDRVREARAGIPAAGGGAKSRGPEARSDSWPSLHILPGPVSGQVAVVEIDRAVAERESDLAACLAPLPKTFVGKFPARFVVDLTGSIFAPTVGGAPNEVSACVVGVLENVVVTPPVSGLATVELSLSVGSSPEGSAPLGLATQGSVAKTPVH